MYTDVDNGIEIVFTDSFYRGEYDYAPIPGLTSRDVARLSEGDGTGYARFMQRLTEFSPVVQMNRIVRQSPERYDTSGFDPLDFFFDAVSFRGTDGRTALQVNVGIPIDNVALPSEPDATVLVDRRIALLESRYTRVVPDRDTLEAPVSAKTRGPGIMSWPFRPSA